MAGKVVPTAQWTERAEAAVVAVRGRWVADANGRYGLQTAGAADAYWVEDESDGRFYTDPEAESGARLLIIGGGRIAL